MIHILHTFYFNNNNIIHANVYYIQSYITFKHIPNLPGGTCCDGSGPHMGEGYPPQEFVSI